MIHLFEKIYITDNFLGFLISEAELGSRVDS